MAASVFGVLAKSIITVFYEQIRHQVIACEFLFDVAHEDVRTFDCLVFEMF